MKVKFIKTVRAEGSSNMALISIYQLASGFITHLPINGKSTHAHTQKHTYTNTNICNATLHTKYNICSGHFHVNTEYKLENNNTQTFEGASAANVFTLQRV